MFSLAKALAVLLEKTLPGRLAGCDLGIAVVANGNGVEVIEIAVFEDLFDAPVHVGEQDLRIKAVYEHADYLVRRDSMSSAALVTARITLGSLVVAIRFRTPARNIPRSESGMGGEDSAAAPRGPAVSCGESIRPTGSPSPRAGSRRVA